ncbi:MAG TPA: hypothetical protein VHE55_18470 [Fimbriimonadaceae bacterium]|nr:hypothetical protein [Fimbriimonadaceae bacterium]
MSLRLLLAFFVLIAQTSFAQVLCACATPPETAPAMTTASACPMQVKKGCACCCAATPGRASRWSVQSSGKCRLTVGKAAPVSPLAAISQFEMPAIAPEELPAIAPLPVRPDFAPIHLVVPRIRPPDPAIHGLRAPPAR